MLAGNALATKLEAVTVTMLFITGNSTVIISNTVANSYRADCTRFYLCVKVPTVVCIVVCDTTVEYVAVTNGKLSCEAVCILKARVEVSVGRTVKNKVV